jgi:hypothetical protein
MAFNMTPVRLLQLLSLSFLANAAASFVIHPQKVTATIPSQIEDQRHRSVNPSSSDRTGSSSLQQRHRLTSLNMLLEVPDAFFTVTFPMLGILLSISKNFARVRMEERAWEQRLEDGREELLRRDPSLTELDLRRREAAQEWSAYGVPRMEEEAARRQEHEQYGRSRRRVDVLDREDDDVSRTKQEYRMTDADIEAFEMEYGVAYDPYYDDPYTVDELPEGKCEIDKLYGDRIYANGEIFYKDAKTGLFYRQGSKPRNLSFFG